MRLLELASDEQRFRYGELDKTHPAQQYVERLLNRIPEEHRQGINIALAPGFSGINALALPNGDVRLATGLLAAAQSEEALLGVVAHEIVHATREHALRRLGKVLSTQGAKKEPVKTMLESLSQQRAAEYEADIRGAMLILRDAGVSPIPYKEFLERLALTETRKDIAHGSSRDRALNILDASFAFHFPHGTKQDTPIPTDIIEGLRGERENPLPKDAIQRPELSTNKPDVLARLHERRAAAQARLTERDLPFALQTVTERKLDEAGLANTAWLLAEWRTRLAVTTPEPASPIAKAVALDMAGGFNILRKITPRAPADASAEKASRKKIDAGVGIPAWVPADLRQNTIDLAALIKSASQVEAWMKAAPVPYGHSDARHVLWNIIALAKESGAFAKVPGGGYQVEGVRAFTDAWLPVLVEYGEKLGIGPVTNREELLAQTAWLLDLSEQSRKELGLTAVQETPRTSFERRLGTAEVESLKKIATFARSSHSFLEAVIRLCDGKQVFQHVASEKEANDIAFQAWETWSAASQEKTANQSDLEDSDVQEIATFLLYRRLYLRADGTMGDRERFRHLYAHAENMGLVGSLKRMKKSLRSKHRAESDDGQEDDQADEDYSFIDEEGRRLLLEELHELFDEDAFFADLTPDQATVLFKKMQLGGGWKTDETQGLPTMITSFVEISHISATRLAARTAVAALHKRDIAGVLQALEEWREQGFDVLTATQNIPEWGPIIQLANNALASRQLERQPIKQIMEIASLISNPFLRGQFQRALVEQHWPRLGFSERLDLVLPAADQNGVSEMRLRERFFDEDVTTKETFAAVKKRLDASLNELLSAGEAKAGLATLLDLDLRKRDPKEMTQTLEALLVSSKNDASLRRMVYEATDVRIDLKNRLLLCESALRTLSTMDEMGKHFLLRKLLASDGGVLTTPERRKPFLDMLFRRWIETKEGEETIGRELERIKNVLDEIHDWELLYVGLQSALRPWIAQPPQPGKETPWDDIYEVEEDYGEAQLKQLKKDQQIGWKGKVPPIAKKKPWAFGPTYHDFAERQVARQVEGLGIISRLPPEAMTPMRFVKESVGRMSAMGVRFLQNLPLVAEIPEEFAAEFSEVYDRVEGQGKLAALAMLENEWPAVWETYRSIGSRIGGGSIVTVYEAETHTGERDALKVINPNIALHLDAIHRLAAEVCDRLGASHGGVYKAARVLLDDVREWVRADIDFKGFLEKDVEFRKRHHGFQPTGHDYRLLVPESKGPAHGMFSRESFVAGLNLTRWNELEQAGHDLRQVTSLLTKNYLTQLLEGRALSDIHPGNFAVTPNKEVAIFDRNFLLEFSDRERYLVTSLLNPLSPMEERTSVLEEYLTDVGGISKTEAARDARRVTDAVSTQAWGDAQRTIVAMKQAGVRIPLTLTLTLKNLHGLQMLSTKAGFKHGLFEALAYQP